MSAFVVTAAHINAIITAVRAVNPGGLYVTLPQPGPQVRIFEMRNPDHLNELGRILLAANIDSVLHRYPDDVPGAYPNPAEFRYTFSNRQTAPLAALKLIHCLDYQCCEVDDWRHTLGRRVLDAMTDQLIRALPGYDAAPYALDGTVSA